MFQNSTLHLPFKRDINDLVTTNPNDFILREFEKRKARNPHFSLRSFAKWLSISPAQLSQMMTGKRPVTATTAVKIADRLGLSPLEKSRLLNSVAHRSGGAVEVTPRKQMSLAEDHFRLISDWYHFAILSLTRTKNAKADPRWIARRLGISAEDANQALMRLERLKIIEMTPIFRQIGEPLSVASDIPSEAIRKYHKQNLDLAAEKLETVAVEKRQFQSVSMTLKPSQMNAYKNLIDDFMDQVMEAADRDPGTEVYHLNVQLFPVTKEV